MQQTQPFVATATDASGNPMSGLTFTWTSSAPTVASITSAGVATGLAQGTTTITATNGTVTSNPATLTVTASTTPPTASQPSFITEVHSATESNYDPPGAPHSTSILSLNVSGANTLLLAAWHAEYDGGGFPNGWAVTNNGVPGTSIVDTDGYTGGAGNRRFRIYYWLNPPPGLNTVVVTNPWADKYSQELAVSVMLLGNVAQANPLGTIALDVSTIARTGERETVPTTTNDLVVHVIADALFVRGTLGIGETSRSVANDGLHQENGDASLWISTKPGEQSSTTVSSSGWTNYLQVINSAAIVVHGLQ
jgi:hypothetical protein